MNIHDNQQAIFEKQPAPAFPAQPVDILDLFAEELPAQQDLRTTNCLGSVSTASTITGSTLGTAACLSSL